MSKILHIIFLCEYPSVVHHCKQNDFIAASVEVFNL